MIIVKGSIPIKLSRREEAVRLVQRLAQQSLDEPGCLAYEVCVQADAPEVIVIFQQWTDLEALEEHFASNHVDRFLDMIPDLIDGEVTSARFDVMPEVFSAEHDELTEPLPIRYADNTVLH